MYERITKIIIRTAVVISITVGIILTVTGGMMDGWDGVAVMLGGQGIFIVLLYLYNRKFK